MATPSNPVRDRLFSDPAALVILGKLNTESRTRVLRFAKYLLATEIEAIEGLDAQGYDALPEPVKTALDMWASSVVEDYLKQ